MPELKELLEKRVGLLDELRTLGNKETLDATDQAKWEKLNAEFDQTSRSVETETKAVTAEREAKQLLEMRAAAVGKSTEAQQSTEITVRNAAIDWVRHGPDMSTESRSALVEYQKRAQLKGVDAAGGYLVPDEWSNEVVSAMKAFGGIREVARGLTTSTGRDLNFAPLDDTANVGEIVGEGFFPGDSGAGDESPPGGGSGAGANRWAALTFSNIIVKTWKYTSKIFTVSRELLQDESYNIEGEIQNAIATRIGRAATADMTTGAGTAGPQGVVTGAAAVAANASAAAGILYADLLNTLHSCDPAYRPNGRWMMHDSILQSIRNIQDGAGQYIWQLSAIPSQPDTLFGYPIQINQNMSATSADTDEPILFGDFNYYMVRDVTGMSLRRLDELYAESDMVGYVAFMRMDGRYLAASADAVFPVKKLVMVA